MLVSDLAYPTTRINIDTFHRCLDLCMTRNIQQTILQCFYIRDCRGGVGSLKYGRWAFIWMARHHPRFFLQLFPLVPLYGRWDDLFYIIIECPSMQSVVLEWYACQLHQDWVRMIQGLPISLCAKWCPSIKGSFARTYPRVMKQFRRCVASSEQEYRVRLTTLRTYMNIPEHHVCKKKWNEIEYTELSQGAILKHAHVFETYDCERWTTTMTPYRASSTSSSSSGKSGKSWKQWKATPPPNAHVVYYMERYLQNPTSSTSSNLEQHMDTFTVRPRTLVVYGIHSHTTLRVRAVTATIALRVGRMGGTVLPFDSVTRPIRFPPTGIPEQLEQLPTDTWSKRVVLPSCLTRYDRIILMTSHTSPIQVVFPHPFNGLVIWWNLGHTTIESTGPQNMYAFQDISYVATDVIAWSTDPSQGLFQHPRYETIWKRLESSQTDLKESLTQVQKSLGPASRNHSTSSLR
jgi:hypothetical protein